MKFLFPITFSFVFFLPIKLVSQTTNYNDVAVIVNDNSIVSTEIASYFKNARSIPNENIIHISASTNELIDSLEFVSIRTQIENYLINANLVNQINYIVTTKGVPLKIASGCVTDENPQSTCASVDSEIALILGTYASSIGMNSFIPNPFFQNTSPFSRAEMGFYLVTRLDAYSKMDLIHLIDNSGPNTFVNKQEVNSIVDVSNSTGSDLIYFSSIFQPANNLLVSEQWNSQFDDNNSILLNQTDVLSYLAIGHGPLPFQNMNYDWQNASVSIMEMCNSSYTFDPTLKDSSELLLGDIIASGCSAGYGNVDFVYFSNILDPSVFVDRYFNSMNQYNLAESFYMSSKTLSWQTVIIGDPKASIQVDELANINNLEEVEFSLYPNPGSDFVRIESINIQTIEVRSTDGSLVYTFTSTNGENSKEIETSTLAPGVYFIQVKTPQGMNTVRWIKK